MSISLQNIAERFLSKIIINSPEHVTIRHASLVDSNQGSFRNDILYIIAPGHDFEILAKDIVINLVCLDSETFNAYCLKCNFNTILIMDLLAPSKMIDEISTMIEDDMFLTNCSLQLYEELSLNKGIQHIVDVAFSLLNNPILVSDTSFKLHAHSEHKDIDDVLWLEITQKGYHPKEYIDRLLKSDLPVTVFESNKPTIIQEPNSKLRYISMKIDMGGKAIGFATILEYNRPFTDQDIKLAEVICKVLACEFSKNINLSQSRGLMYEYLIIELLDNAHMKKELIEERLQYINLKIKESIFVFVALLKSEYALNRVHLNYLCNELELVIPNNKCILYQDRLVMIVSQHHNQRPFSDETFKILTRFLEVNHLVGSISRKFSNVCAIKEHYQQACDAARIGMHLEPEKNYYEYAPYGIYNLLDITSNSRDLHNFCEPKLIEIIEYDNNHQTNYAHTLYTYLKANQDPVTTAHKLAIHRNTIDYRINKIASLFGISIKDSDVILSLNLSFKILIYLGEDNFRTDHNI